MRPSAFLAGCFFAMLAPFAFAATSGIVVHATTSEPIAGARVSVRRMPSPVQHLLEAMSGTTPAPIANTTTGKDGVFTFQQNLDGMFLVEVEHDGFAPESVLALAGSSATTIPIKPAASRTGRVTANGKPVKDATVIAMWGNMVRWRGKTNDDGVYTMPAPDGWAGAIVILHPDLAPHVIEINGNRTRLDAKLAQGVTFSGKVVDAEQKPVANARVFALTQWSAAITAEDGTFTLRGLTRAPELIEAFAGDASGDATPANDTATIVITPRPTISGAVRGADRRAIAGVPLMANGITPMPKDAKPPARTSTARPRWAVTDERGNYRLEHLNDKSTYTIAPYLQSELSLTKLSGIAPGAKNADLVATTPDGYSGIVLDERKKPVTGAVVRLESATMPIVYGGARRSTPTVRTGRDGRFLIRASDPFVMSRPSGMGLRLLASQPGYAIAISEEVSKERPATIILTRGITIEGEVVDANGKPVAGAGILAMERGRAATPMALDSSLSSGSLTPFVETDADGKFTLQLNAATHDFGAWKQGAGSAQATSVVITEGMPPLRLVLEPDVEVRGRVVRGTEPVQGGMVAAYGANNSNASVQVADDGTFLVESLSPGQYRLEYMDDSGNLAGEAMVKAPSNDAVIKLPALSKVHGRVVDNDTHAVLRRYSVSLNGEISKTASVRDEEAFTLEVPEGTAELSVHASGYQKATHRVTVAAGETAEVTIPITRGRVITGTITAEDGTPIVGASVLANKEESVYTWANGAYAITVSSAPVQLDIRARDYLPKKIDLGSGNADTKIDAVLTRGRVVRGRVVTSDDAPVAQARVHAWVNGASQQAETDANGAFTMSGLDSGEVRFMAMRSQLRSETITVDLSKTTDVVIRMNATGPTGTVFGMLKGAEAGGWSTATVMAGMAHAFVARDGRFRIENVRAGETQLTATVMNIDGSMRTTPPVKVTVIEGGEVEANLELTTGVTVQGRVTQEGLPLPGHAVQFNASNRVSAGRTNATGEYVVNGLESGVTYAVTVANPSRGNLFTTQYTVPGNSRFDILIEQMRIEGRVLDTSGRAIAGAWISIEDDAFQNEQTRSDETGAFTLTMMRSNVFTLRASKDGYATATQQMTGSAPVLITLTPAAPR